jgi:hypothetical protein
MLGVEQDPGWQLMMDTLECLHSGISTGLEEIRAVNAGEEEMRAAVRGQQTQVSLRNSAFAYKT